MDAARLASIYREAHNIMRNIDGMQPQESFDELLKYLYYMESKGNRTQSEFALNSGPDRGGRFTASTSVLAKQIRNESREIFRKAGPAAAALWPDGNYRVSDECLLRLSSLFSGVRLDTVELDVRSAALREFLSPEIRKGLGIYLTPDEVVRTMVAILDPAPGLKILDPACGSGTFLLEVARYWNKSRSLARGIVTGIDKNPRMLVLADLNLANIGNLEFDGHLLDSLLDTNEGSADGWYNKFDLIFTNPPFGVYIDSATHREFNFSSCLDSEGAPYARQQSEIVFIEQCFRFLKPGGRLAIVLPRSVVTNDSERITGPRRYFGTQGYIQGVMTLPPETFYATGTQANTVVVIAKKYERSSEMAEPTKIWAAEITNCGYDSTGRTRLGSQLPTIHEDVRRLVEEDISSDHCRWLTNVEKGETFSALPKLLTSETEVDGLPLSELAELITTGRTPARSAYTDCGLFVVKVGNLTGKGIDWSARDRNFISESEKPKRQKAGLLLQPGDIVMTSSAHSPVYIAKKVDVITQIPSWVGGSASLVGEVLLIRPMRDKIDPYILLGYLRHPKVVGQIQRMVRGQTAHLHPRDLGALKIPHNLINGSSSINEVSNALRAECRLAEESNELSWKLDQLLADLQIS